MSKISREKLELKLNILFQMGVDCGQAEFMSGEYSGKIAAEAEELASKLYETKSKLIQYILKHTVGGKKNG